MPAQNKQSSPSAATFRLAVSKGALHLLTAVGTYFFVAFISSDSEAWMAYALISAWWAMLYVGHVASIRLSALPIAFIGGAVIGGDVFYLVGLKSEPFLPKGDHGLSIAWGILLCTPIVINEGVRWGEKLLAQYRSTRAEMDASKP